MANAEGKKKPKATIENKKKQQDADAKKSADNNKETKGPKEVDGKKVPKIVDHKEASTPQNGAKDSNASAKLEPTTLLEHRDEVIVVESDPRPIHDLCVYCNEVNRRWPPPPYIDPHPRDPNLLYPGDIDPYFQPARGDILVIHPGLHMGLMEIHRQLPDGGFVASYDGSAKFQFALGDLVLRMGSYDETQPIIEDVEKNKIPKKGEKSLKKGIEKKNNSKVQEKNKGNEKTSKTKENLNSKGNKGNEKSFKEIEDDLGACIGLQVSTEMLPSSYHPYERLELYTCCGFITKEEAEKLEAEKLAIEIEKERIANEINNKNPKGKNGKIKGTKDPNEIVKKKTPRNDEANTNKGGKNLHLENKWEDKRELLAHHKPQNLEMESMMNQVTLNDFNNLPPKPKWRYLGSQLQLDTKSQLLLEKQCKGFTYFYRRYMKAGTRCGMHTLTPVLGEILINVGWFNNWYKNLEKWQREENKYKSLVKWYKPDMPNKGELISGMILLRPLVGREFGKWPGWGLDGKKVMPPLPPLLVEEKGIIEDSPYGEEEKNVVSKCDCHWKIPCPKPPCPCHTYDPCPKIPGCTCIYCNPLPRTPSIELGYEKEVKHLQDEEIDGKLKGTNEKGKLKSGKPTQNEKNEKAMVKDKDKKSPKEKATNKQGKGKDAKEKGEVGRGKAKDEKDSKNNPKEVKDIKVVDSKIEILVSKVPPKPYSWGSVEMYLFYGEEEGWEYWGRSDRICDTPYPLPFETSKNKFFHVDDLIGNLRKDEGEVTRKEGNNINKNERDKENDMEEVKILDKNKKNDLKEFEATKGGNGK